MSERDRAQSPTDLGEAENPPTFPRGIDLRDETAPKREPAPTNEVLIITGYSGAGRTGAARALEDLDWYVVDNLPPRCCPPWSG